MPARAAACTFAVLASLAAADPPQAAPVPIQFVSAGATLHGNFFPADTPAPATLLLLPGFPGNPNDVLGLGALLVSQGVNVMTFSPRGMHASEGTFGFANTLADTGAALDWLEQPEVQRRFHVDSAKLTIGGHSFGGGMALAYAARDPRVRRVVSIAGNDHAEFVRELQRNAVFAEGFRKSLADTAAPKGPVRLDPSAGLNELAEHQDVYGLRENAGKLADRSILLIGGWEDTQVTVDRILLPFYRALKEAGAKDVIFRVYHDGHNFTQVRPQLASDVRAWLEGGQGSAR